MSERCFKCFKPKSVCLCKYGKELDTGVKFVFLMHPKEFRRQRTGTGYLSHLCLKDSEVIVGLDFTKNARFQQLLADPQYFPVLMYPGEDVITAQTITQRLAVENDAAAPQKKLLLIILDATWFCAKKMIEHNQFLLELPKLSFSGSYRSIFTFKREPSPECISTIECCYYIIKELQAGGFVDSSLDPEPLMNIFKAMIKLQLTAENERVLGIRTNSHDYDAKYNKIRKIPKFLDCRVEPDNDTSD
ncbi:MAG: DTW domain-containing protein [Treponema sp.]|nr:DTW domain-containing protein [Treponema sp.]